MLFYCDWFDPVNGTKIDKRSKIVDIRMDKRYNAFDPFILAHKVNQVYYVPYPSHQRHKIGWCAAIKTKPRGKIESDFQDLEVAYQDNEMSQVPENIELEHITELVDREVEGQQFDSSILLEHNEQEVDNEEDTIDSSGSGKSVEEEEEEENDEFYSD